MTYPKKIDNILVKNIKKIVANAKGNIYQRINNELINTYWLIGKEIIDMENKNNIDNQTSRQIILNLSKQLTKEVGKGFSRSNLFNMRKFYQEYPSVQTVSGHLSWSHIASRHVTILPNKEELIEEVKCIIKE
ncbi:DUF1016 N-terminal domain-containing protein [Odoribacter sp. OttesenSCG-928-L07]|nr:DUF1016 N-terminal domain-containing protein [Odoribacter sp. OttesenSCG-928-L07]MDL2239942.1 DUF1016 N-terminal domain-containing protein [Bacteroidales bacterium OttesenSCG-928-L14]